MVTQGDFNRIFRFCSKVKFWVDMTYSRYSGCLNRKRWLKVRFLMRMVMLRLTDVSYLTPLPPIPQKDIKIMYFFEQNLNIIKGKQKTTKYIHGAANPPHRTARRRHRLVHIRVVSNPPFLSNPQREGHAILCILALIQFVSPLPHLQISTKRLVVPPALTVPH